MATLAKLRNGALPIYAEPQPALQRRVIIMSKLLIAIALTAALSTPALAVPGAGPDYHRYVQSERHQKQSQACNRQNNDPYWKPCNYSDSNSCE